MNCKAPHHMPLFLIGLSPLLKGALLLAITVIFSTSLPLSASTVQAAQFSLPNLKKLQRKFLKRKRRKRKRRSGKTRPPQSTQNLGEQSAQPLPPLPVRNPRHLQKTVPQTVFNRKSRLNRQKRRKETRVQRRKRREFAENIAPQAGAVPPAPARKPNRHPSKVVEESWSPALIKDALAQCRTLGVKAPALPPVQKGRCGNPAPVLLENLDSVTIRPAATLSCPMAASLDRWLTEEVQPLALKTFGTKVAQIRNVSSYVCRNRYGDTQKKISEHAYANALDIAWFELRGGERISVQDDWPEPQGDAADNRKSVFLHALHKSACKLFGTVLGPDANDAHKDHFHLDRAPRRRSNYCR